MQCACRINAMRPDSADFSSWSRCLVLWWVLGGCFEETWTTPCCLGVRCAPSGTEIYWPQAVWRWLEKLCCWSDLAKELALKLAFGREVRVSAWTGEGILLEWKVICKDVEKWRQLYRNRWTEGVNQEGLCFVLSVRLVRWRFFWRILSLDRMVPSLLDDLQ